MWGCREMKDKKSLLRVVRAPDGTVSLDFVGKKPGGAPMCATTWPACKRPGKPGPWNGPFDTAIPPEVYDAMEAELRGADGPA